MKSRIVCSLLLCAGSLYSMQERQEDWRTSPGQQIRNTPQTTTPAPMDIIDPLTTPATKIFLTAPKAGAPAPKDIQRLITLVSQDGHEHTVRYSAANRFSNLLKTMMEVTGEPGEPIPFLERSNKEIHFIVELLTFLVYTESPQLTPDELKAFPEELKTRIVEFIRAHTHNFVTISFAHLVELINYFDIPLASHALLPVVNEKTVVLPAPLPPLIFVSKGGKQQYPINVEALAFSGMLTGMVDFRSHVGGVDNTKPIELGGTDNHISFIAKLLNFLLAEQHLYGQPIQTQHIIDFIKAYTRNFTTIGFGELLNLINYFDIPIALHALATIQQPLPLPTTPAEEVEYNQQLADIFTLAQGAAVIDGVTGQVHNKDLWQLFGRMLYSRWLKYPEVVERLNFMTMHRGGKIVQTIRRTGRHVGSLLGSKKQESGAEVKQKIEEMLNFITGQKNIQQIVLDAYIQQHDHLLKMLQINQDGCRRTVFSPDRQMFALGTEAGTIRLWNIQTGKELQTLKGPENHSVFSLAFSPDGQTIAAGSPDASIILWNLHTGEFQRQILHTSYVNSMAFSPDGNILASGSWNGIRLWNIHTNKERILTGHTNCVNAVAFSPDGKTVASGSCDRTIKLWNVQTDELRKTLEGHVNYVDFLIFSPDGQTIASGSQNEIKLWNVCTGELLRNFEELAHVSSMAFSPDGNILATGLWGKIKLWNVHTGKLLQTFEIDLEAFSTDSLAFSLDGTNIFSAEHDGIRFWDCDVRLREALGASLAQPNSAGTSASSSSSPSAGTSTSASISAPRPASD